MMLRYAYLSKTDAPARFRLHPRERASLDTRGNVVKRLLPTKQQERSTETMGAQLLTTVTEIAFTDPEESVIVTLSTGRTLELFGDGMIQEITVAEDSEMNILESQI